MTARKNQQQDFHRLTKQQTLTEILQNMSKNQTNLYCFKNIPILPLPHL